MKKVLSLWLAVCLLCGVGTVGASAVALPGKARLDSFEAAISQIGAESLMVKMDPAEVAMPQAGYADLTLEQQEEVFVIALQATFTLYMLEIMIWGPIASSLTTNEGAALKDAAKANEFQEKFNEAAAAASNSAAIKAFQDFCADEDTIVAAYLAGTLESQLMSFLEACIIAINASAEPVCREYLKPECYAFMTENFEFVALYYILLLHADELEALEETLDDALKTKIEAMSVDYEAMYDFVEEGEWVEARASAKRVNAVLEEILVELGWIEPSEEPEEPITPASPDKIYEFLAGFLPDFLATGMTFVVKYLFFGWLWGRWL